MKITHNGKTYTTAIDSNILWEEAIKIWINNGDLELIETKPEEKPDHDKAMEIPEVPEYSSSDCFLDNHKNNTIGKQLELLTNSLNAVIRYLKSNNL